MFPPSASSSILHLLLLLLSQRKPALLCLEKKKKKKRATESLPQSRRRWNLEAAMSVSDQANSLVTSLQPSGGVE